MPDYDGYLMAFKDGYEKGQLAMRERAAVVAEAHGEGRLDAECCGDHPHHHIRALEPEEPAAEGRVREMLVDPAENKAPTSGDTCICRHARSDHHLDRFHVSAHCLKCTCDLFEAS